MYTQHYFRFPVIVLLLWLISLMVLQDVYADMLYKWIDLDGQEHITDYPPPESEKKPGTEVTVDETPKRLALDKRTFQRGISSLDHRLKRIRSQVAAQIKKFVTGVTTERSPYSMLFLGLILMIHFYFAVCLFIFSQKIGVKTSWLAWIPIFNILPLLATAGRPWWWAVLLLGPLAVFVPLVNTNLYAVLCLAVLFAIDLVLFVVIWTNVCRNLWIQKWLGLLILVPIAQLILIGHLAFKKEPFIERINRLRPALAALICFCCSMAAAYVMLLLR
jgi:hypothetical protein